LKKLYQPGGSKGMLSRLAKYLLKVNTAFATANHLRTNHWFDHCDTSQTQISI